MQQIAKLFDEITYLNFEYRDKLECSQSALDDVYSPLISPEAKEAILTIAHNRKEIEELEEKLYNIRRK
jgi:hypothetical protein